jgi:transposase
MFELALEASVIATSLKVKPQTVRRWRREFKANGRDGLRARTHAGRPPRLTPEQKQRLAELLQKTPAECGLDKYLWTQQLIADLIAREFNGVSYRWCARWPRRIRGFRCITCHHTPRTSTRWRGCGAYQIPPDGQPHDQRTGRIARRSPPAPGRRRQ